MSAVSNAIQRGVEVDYGAELDGSISRLWSEGVFAQSRFSHEMNRNIC